MEKKKEKDRIVYDEKTGRLMCLLRKHQIPLKPLDKQIIKEI